MTDQTKVHFPENEFKEAAIRLIGTQKKFDQNGDPIEPGSDYGWTYNPQRMKDCRKGALWQFEKCRNEIDALKAENERLRAALEFYAKCEHMQIGDGYWEEVSGDEWCSIFISDNADDSAHVENGLTARAALSGKVE